VKIERELERVDLSAIIFLKDKRSASNATLQMNETMKREKG